MKLITWVVFGWMALLTVAQAASFDCAKATTGVEKTICTDEFLSKIDGSLSTAFQHYLERSEDKRRARNEQNKWLKKISNICQDKDCLVQTYQERVEELTTSQNLTEGLYLFRCDNNHSQLTIIESVLADKNMFSNTEDMKGDSILNPNDLVKVKYKHVDTGNGAGYDDPYIERDRDAHYQCKLKSAIYKVDVYPHIFNADVNGMCGAAAPTLDISITRDGKKILNYFPLIDSCMDGHVIDAIRLNENNGSISLYSGLREYKLHREKTFLLDDIKTGFDSALFDDAQPSGNPNIDLQHGVATHDFALVTQSLDKGADINYHEQSSSGVFCNIASGRAKAVSENRAEEYDKETGKLVDLLISRGATPTITASPGRTFVDCAGFLPTITLHKLLVLGWPNDYSYWLYAGVISAKPDIIKEAIEHGADPNKPARNGKYRYLDFALSSPSGLSMKGQEAEQQKGLDAMEVLLKSGAKVDDGKLYQGGDIIKTYILFGGRQNIQPVFELLIRYASPEARKNSLDWLIHTKSNMAANHVVIDQDQQTTFNWLVKRLSQ